ncbi:MAG: radical SAM protein [Candidatus Adiutrix sp.]|nr:radical SAM protein [Candidatus Adiutrix sp.]
MDILRAKTLDLRQTGPLTPERAANSRLNEEEALAEIEMPAAAPRRLVLELTSACNLSCVACGRNSAAFRPTTFKFEWLARFEPFVPYLEEVTLMGWGEPTIHPRFTHFLHWARERGLRQYFCTNGMRLGDLESDIFAAETDIIAVSLDGAAPATNDRLRRGSKFKQIVADLGRIAGRRARLKSAWPYLNFVFTAMKDNLGELPELVCLAADLGLDEVKVVYFTAFDEKLVPQTLFGQRGQTEDAFALAAETAGRLGLALKLPHLEGDDPAGVEHHKPCYAAWRDLFLGSDGWFRPCMSTARKFFQVDKHKSIAESWRAPEYQIHRRLVNSREMDTHCQSCHQSSFANWNLRSSFIQAGLSFAPAW